MKRMGLSTALAIVVLLPMAPTVLFADEVVRGRVISADGDPISGAIVKSTRVFWVETDAEGAYQLEMVDEVIQARAPGYGPVTKRREPGQKTVDFVLSQTDDTWEVPLCSTITDSGKRFGFPWSLPTLGSRIESGSDSHHGGEWYRATIRPKGSEPAQLHYRSWVYCCGGMPLSSRYTESTELSERLFFAAGRSTALPSDSTRFTYSAGLDARGIDMDGKEWRWVGPLWNLAISYSGASKEEAARLDAMIDSMCFDDRTPQKRKPGAIVYPWWF